MNDDFDYDLDEEPDESFFTPGSDLVVSIFGLMALFFLLLVVREGKVRDAYTEQKDVVRKVEGDYQALKEENERLKNQLAAYAAFEKALLNTFGKEATENDGLLVSMVGSLFEGHERGLRIRSLIEDVATAQGGTMTAEEQADLFTSVLARLFQDFEEKSAVSISSDVILQKEVKKLRETNEDLLSEVRSLKGENVSLQNEVRRLTADLEKNLAEIQQLKADLAANNSRIKELETALEMRLTDLLAQAAVNQNLRKQFDEQKKQNSTLEEVLKKLELMLPPGEKGESLEKRFVAFINESEQAKLKENVAVTVPTTTENWFESGSAKPGEGMRKYIEDIAYQELNNKIATLNEEFDSVVIIGHTDGENISQTTGNVEELLSREALDYRKMVPGDNLELGFARALAVAEIIREVARQRGNYRIANLKYHVVSAGPTLAPSNESRFQRKDDRRRRVDIRITRIEGPGVFESPSLIDDKEELERLEEAARKKKAGQPTPSSINDFLRSFERR